MRLLSRNTEGTEHCQRGAFAAYFLRMSLEQLESSILALKPEERKQFARWFEEHRYELIPGNTEDEELTPEQQAEILRRRQQALAHPELLEPWQGTVDRVRQRLHDLRSQKAASR
jgi:hypothetical protein